MPSENTVKTNKQIMVYTESVCNSHASNARHIYIYTQMEIYLLLHYCFKHQYIRTLELWTPRHCKPFVTVKCMYFWTCTGNITSPFVYCLLSIYWLSVESVLTNCSGFIHCLCCFYQKWKATFPWLLLYRYTIDKEFHLHLGMLVNTITCIHNDELDANLACSQSWYQQLPFS